MASKRRGRKPMVKKFNATIEGSTDGPFATYVVRWTARKKHRTLWTKQRAENAAGQLVAVSHTPLIGDPDAGVTVHPIPAGATTLRAHVWEWPNPGNLASETITILV